MSSAGSNGILDGRANAQCFLDWQKSVNDFKPFIFQGDRAYLFRPFSDNLMAFNHREVFTAAHQDPLRAYLEALTRGTPWPAY